jgi:hypothetical protein
LAHSLCPLEKTPDLTTCSHAHFSLMAIAGKKRTREGVNSGKDRYGSGIASSRLPKSQAKRDAWVQQVGADGQTLLDWLAATARDDWSRLPAVDILRQVWEQQYEMMPRQRITSLCRLNTKPLGSTSSPGSSTSHSADGCLQVTLAPPRGY